ILLCSSRRRHTRSYGDWSSDVCSSDLNRARTQAEIRESSCLTLNGSEPGLIGYWRLAEGIGQTAFDRSPTGNNGRLGSNANPAEIGRASCRERVQREGATVWCEETTAD